MNIGVITPTIGTKHLAKCLDSVSNQTYKDLTHYIFVDGESNFEKVRHLIKDYNTKNVFLEQSIGHSGWLGHRVYAAAPFLVESEIICYLDEDNWLESNHIDSMYQNILQGFDWCYSLRKIFDKDGNYLLNDDCESLGKWPTFQGSVHHIDTSAYMVIKDKIKAISHSWYKKFNADRVFFQALKNFCPNYTCSGEYSLCYRLGSTERSVKKEFFEKGNLIMKQKYEGGFPWSNFS